MNRFLLAFVALVLAACGQLSVTDPTVGASHSSFPDARVSDNVGTDAGVVMGIDTDVALPPIGTVIVNVTDQLDADQYTAPMDDSSYVGQPCTWVPPFPTMDCGDSAWASYYGTYHAYRCAGAECLAIPPCLTDEDCTLPGQRCFPLAVTYDRQLGCAYCRTNMDCPVMPGKKFLHCLPNEGRCIYEE